MGTRGTCHCEASKEFQPQMNTDNVSTADGRLASISHVTCFLFAFICVNVRLDCSYLLGLVCRGARSFAFLW
jgi:hypothetical protein